MLQIIGLKTIPLVKPGDNIGDHIVNAAKQDRIRIENNDVIVVAQKIISKAEGSVVRVKRRGPISHGSASRSGKRKGPQAC